MMAVEAKQEIGVQAAYQDEVVADNTNHVMVTNQAAIGPPSKSKVGSSISTKSSPLIKRANPNKILGDFHLTRLN